ncbi:MAG: FIG00933091: hypothetical protein, partial [uncultured Ramlibacter sp.]
AASRVLLRPGFLLAPHASRPRAGAEAGRHFRPGRHAGPEDRAGERCGDSGQVAGRAGRFPGQPEGAHPLAERAAGRLQAAQGHGPAQAGGGPGGDPQPSCRRRRSPGAQPAGRCRQDHERHRCQEHPDRGPDVGHRLLRRPHARTALDLVPAGGETVHLQGGTGRQVRPPGRQGGGPRLAEAGGRQHRPLRHPQGARWPVPGDRRGGEEDPARPGGHRQRHPVAGIRRHPL